MPALLKNRISVVLGHVITWVPKVHCLCTVLGRGSEISFNLLYGFHESKFCLNRSLVVVTVVRVVVVVTIVLVVVPIVRVLCILLFISGSRNLNCN